LPIGFSSRDIDRLGDHGFFEICDSIADADIVLTYGDDSLIADVRINDFAEALPAGTSLQTRLHLYLTFSQGNEDSASLSAEAGVSIQRMIVEELIQRTAPYLRFQPGLPVRMSGVLGNLGRESHSARCGDPDP
jgi:hypothetical protein